MTIFIFVGGYSETLGFGLCDNFHFVGGGGGYSETLRFGLCDNFHFGVGYSETVLQNRGYSTSFWTKISTTPAGSCITDSLSHTTWRLINTSSHINFTEFYMKILAFTLENTHGMSAVQVDYNSRTIFCTFPAVVFNAL